MHDLFSLKCHTHGIREALTVPKDCVSVLALGWFTFFVSKSAASLNSRNHFIEFDRKGSRPYFVSHLTVQFPQIATAEDAEAWHRLREPGVESECERCGVVFVGGRTCSPARELSSTFSWSARHYENLIARLCNP
jgi:hypothetical protein